MSGSPQAIVHIPRKGGCKSMKRICNQLCYLDQDEDVVLELSERHGGAQMSRAEYEDWARLWAEQTGHYFNGESLYDGEQDLTTHIIVSFPPGTDKRAAYKAGRAWAEDVFGSGRNGGEWDYITAFHTNKPHPHVHVIVNRRSLAERGEWLAISHRNRFLNYDTLREALADAAWNQGIELDATSREQRGLEGRGPTTAEYRRQARIELRNHFNEDPDIYEVARDGQQEVFPELTGLRPVSDDGGEPRGTGGFGIDDNNRFAMSAIPVASRREAGEARDQRRNQIRQRSAADEAEDGPGRRRVPRPRPFVEDEGGSQGTPPVTQHPDFDILAARQLHDEMAQADDRVRNGRSGSRTSHEGQDRTTATDLTTGRADNPSESDEVGDQIRRELAEYRDRQIEASRQNREIEDVATGPSRRRTAAGTTEAMSSASTDNDRQGKRAQSSANNSATVVERDDSGATQAGSRGPRPRAEPFETRGQKIRRRSAERAANRERQRALEQSGGQADGSENDAPSVDTVPDIRQPYPVQSHNRQQNQAGADPKPSQSRAFPVVGPNSAPPDQSARREDPEVNRALSIERDRDRTR